MASPPSPLPPNPPPLAPIDALALSLVLVTSSASLFLLLVVGTFCCCVLWLWSKQRLWRAREANEWGHPGTLHRDGSALEWRKDGQPIRLYGAQGAAIIHCASDLGIGEPSATAAAPDVHATDVLAPLPRGSIAPAGRYRVRRMTSAGDAEPLAIDVDRPSTTSTGGVQRGSSVSTPSRASERMSMPDDGFLSFGVGVAPIAPVITRRESPPRFASRIDEEADEAALALELEDAQEDLELPKHGHPSRIMRAKKHNAAGTPGRDAYWGRAH